MRKTIAILSLLATSLMSYGASAQPEGAPPAAPPPEGAPPVAAAPEAAPAPAVAPVADSAAASKMILGVDGAFQLPFGDLADATGMGFGALLRFEYNVMPQLNLTARVGYIYSLNKEISQTVPLMGTIKAKYGMDNIPIWVGAKYFLTDMIYGGVEVGANMLKGKVDMNGVSASSTETKFGANVGAGVLLSGLDLRAQLEILNLSEAGKSMALMVNVGYNFLAF